MGTFCSTSTVAPIIEIYHKTYVICCGEGTVGSPYLSARIPKTFESLLFACLALARLGMLHEKLTGEVTS